MDMKDTHAFTVGIILCVFVLGLCALCVYLTIIMLETAAASGGSVSVQLALFFVIIFAPGQFIATIPAAVFYIRGFKDNGPIRIISVVEFTLTMAALVLTVSMIILLFCSLDDYESISAIKLFEGWMQI